MVYSAGVTVLHKRNYTERYEISCGRLSSRSEHHQASQRRRLKSSCAGKIRNVEETTPILESEERRFKRLLTNMAIGDKLPSHLWREMVDLSAGRVGEDMLKSLWLQRLNPNSQAILSSADSDMTKVTVMADKIHEVLDNHNINAVSAPVAQSSSVVPVTSHEQTQIDELCAQMRELTRQVSAIASAKSNDQHSRSRSKQRSPGDRFNRQRSKSRADGHCWYHIRFGAEATKCTSPCSFPQGN